MKACILVASCALTLCFTSASGFAADFEFWFSGYGTTFYKDTASRAYCYSTTFTAVDADGAPGAYHPDDVGHIREGQTLKGLDAPENAGYSGGPTGWRNVLVADPVNSNVPYRQKDGAYAGYFISQTWLEDTSKETVDVARYVNASEIPYIAFPDNNSFTKRAGTGYAGDIGLAWSLDTNRKVAFVVADKSDRPLIGEASIALFQHLFETKVDARTNSGIQKNTTITYLVFPGSRTTHKWPLSAFQIEVAAQQLLESKIGDEDLSRICPGQ
jgi:hypothetical protein